MAKLVTLTTILTVFTTILTQRIVHAKTKETFIGEWARTGDTLQFDNDGYFWFSGRSDDVFKVKGLWVSPIEVEAAITEHEEVLEAAVVSFEDVDGLTQAKAFVVLNP